MSQHWFVFRGKQKLGPFSSAQLREQVRAGELQPQDFLMLDGQNQWMTAASVKGLFPTATEAPRASASGGDPVSPKPASPLARPDAVAGESPPPSGTVPKSSLLRSQPRLWVVAACCVPVVLGIIIWASSRGHKSTLQQDSPAGFASSGSDLDDLARLFSQDVIVGTEEFHRPQDPVWIEAMKKLRSSSDKTVAAAVAAAEDAVILRADALALDAKVTEENSARMDKGLGKLLEDRSEGVYYNYEGNNLDEDVRAGRVSQEFANAYRKQLAREEAAQLEFMGEAFQSYVNRYHANPKIRNARIDAEGKEGDVFVKHLVPALRARAGAKTDASPLDLKAGQHCMYPDTSLASRMKPRVWLNLFSGSCRYDRELTRLSFLFEYRRGNGTCLVTAYIPRLRPSESFRLIPFAGAWRKTTNKDVSESGAAVRYSVWCDQFAIENRELPPQGPVGATLAYGINVLMGDTAFVCDPAEHPIGSYAAAVARAQESRIKKPPEREFFGRYGLSFTEVKPEGDAYKVQARLDEYEVDSKQKIVSSATCAGVLRVVPQIKPQLPVSPEVAQQQREAKMEEDRKKQEENKKQRAAAANKTRAERKQDAAQRRQKADQEQQEQTIQRRLARADLVCELEGEGKKHRFEISIEANGHLKWEALDPPLKWRVVLPAEQVRKREQRMAETKDKNDRLRNARNLAMQGKKVEAEKALNDFIASAPGELWEKWAKDILSHLDQYAERAAQLRAASSEKAAQEAAAVPIRQSYERSVAEARDILLGAIQRNINRLETGSGLDKRKVEEAVGRLRVAKELFEKYGRVPWSKDLWSDTSAYLSAVTEARAQALANYKEAQMPEDLKKLIDGKAVAVWRQNSGLKTITFYPHGTVNHPDFPHTWSFHEGRLTIRWQHDKTSFVVDECAVAPDGLSYTGKDHKGDSISGILYGQSIAPVSSMRPRK